MHIQRMNVSDIHLSTRVCFKPCCPCPIRSQGNQETNCAKPRVFVIIHGKQLSCALRISIVNGICRRGCARRIGVPAGVHQLPYRSISLNGRISHNTARHRNKTMIGGESGISCRGQVNGGIVQCCRICHRVRRAANNKSVRSFGSGALHTIL